MRPPISELKRQFDRATKAGWLPAIRAAADAHEFTTELLLGIASRETNLDANYQLVPGDHGHGFSMWQIDIGSYPEWIKSGAWKNVDRAVNKAAEVLQEKQREVQNELKRQRLVLSMADIERIAVAAYNCGSERAINCFRTWNDPDRGTTGRDYSRDVLSRRDAFASFLSISPRPKPATDLPAPPDAEPNEALLNRFGQLKDNDDVQNLGRSAGRKLLNRLGTPIGTFIAALEAGNVKAWLVVIIIFVGAAIFIYDERRAIVRLWARVKASL